MGKLSFLIGAGAGYVLGTRAGRARYEQIKQVAGRAWQGQSVQDQIESARRQLKQRSADVAVAASQAALHGAGQTAKNVATASFAAARGKRHPVVRGSVDTGGDPATPIQGSTGDATGAGGRTTDATEAPSDPTDAGTADAQARPTAQTAGSGAAAEPGSPA